MKVWYTVVMGEAKRSGVEGQEMDKDLRGAVMVLIWVACVALGFYIGSSCSQGVF